MSTDCKDLDMEFHLKISLLQKGPKVACNSKGAITNI